MGITGAPFGRTELLVPPPEPPERALARGKGPRGLGRWEQVEKCFIMGSFCELLKKQRKNQNANLLKLLGLSSY